MFQLHHFACEHFYLLVHGLSHSLLEYFTASKSLVPVNAIWTGTDILISMLKWAGLPSRKKWLDYQAERNVHVLYM